jgi:hypothetical protein
MALPPPKGHGIPLNDAAAQTKRAQDGGSKGGLFLRKELDDLLAQPGCAGVRFYYGLDASGQDTLILVGVDQNGNDMVNGVLMDSHYPCPPYCGDGNSLNS